MAEAPVRRALPPAQTACVAGALGALLGVAFAFHWALACIVALAALVAARAFESSDRAALVVIAVLPPLCGLGRGVPLPGVKISEALLIVCVAWLLLRPAVRRPPESPVVNGALALTAVLGIVAGLHALVTGVRIDVAVLLRNALFPGLLAMTWWAARQLPARHRATALTGLVVTSAPVALMSIAQYLDLPGVRQLIIDIVGSGVMPTPGSAFSRATGPFTIAHSLNAYLLFPLLIAALCLATGTPLRIRRPWVIAVLVLNIGAVVVSVTLTTAVWLVVAILVASARLGVWRKTLGWLAVGAAFSVALGFEAIADRWQQQTSPAAGTTEGLLPQTLQYRLIIWQRDYLPLVGDSLLLGSNGGQPDVFFGSSENAFLTLLLRGGLPLLASTVALLAVIGFRAWAQAGHGDPIERVTGACLFGVLAFLPIAGLFWPYVTNAGFPQTFFALAGGFLTIASRGRRSGPRERLPRAASHRGR